MEALSSFFSYILTIISIETDSVAILEFRHVIGIKKDTEWLTDLQVLVFWMPLLAGCWKTHNENLKRNRWKNIFRWTKLFRKDEKWTERMWLPHSEWASPILSFSAATWMSWHLHNASCWFEGRCLAQVMWRAVVSWDAPQRLSLRWRKASCGVIFLPFSLLTRRCFPVVKKLPSLQPQCWQFSCWCENPTRPVAFASVFKEAEVQNTTAWMGAFQGGWSGIQNLNHPRHNFTVKNPTK